MESKPREQELTTALSLQIDLVNARGSVDSEEVLEFLQAELPLEATFRRRMLPPHAQLDGGLTWLLVLSVGASAVTIGDALWRAYSRFLRPVPEQEDGEKAGLLIEMRNGNEKVQLVRIGPDEAHREVVIKQVSEIVEILAGDDGEDGDELRAKLERSATWIHVK